MSRPEVRIERLTVGAYTVPTDAPEADGTIAWDATTIVVVEAVSGGRTGLGYSYADRGAAALIRDRLAPLVEGGDALAVAAHWQAMVRAVRNLGRPGVASTAISAVDNALWDLKACLLDRPLVDLLGAVRPSVPVYGSGGFTTYTDRQLAAQLAAWVEGGIRMVKMKVGAEPGRDVERVRVARRAIGPRAELFVDANGACSAKQALGFARAFAEAAGVIWFEEPVSSDNLRDLRLLRERAPAGMDITAGEYGYDPMYFRRMLEAQAVDVLQPDATRCGGVSGFLMAEALAEAFDVPLSAHTAPSLHAHLGCACARVRHVEYFHDHARIEPMLFEGALAPAGGELHPDRTRPGLGLVLKRADAARFAV